MSAYTEAVKEKLEGLEHVAPGLAEGCDECPRDIDEDEGGFSWHACDACGSRLGGLRYAAHGWCNGEKIHLDICEDCLCYLANGDEPKTWEEG